MPRIPTSLALLALALAVPLAAATVDSVEALVAAAKQAGAGTTIELATGRFELEAPLELPAGTTLTGAGAGKTILTAAAGWKADPATLPDPETNFRKFDKTGYLIHLAEKAEKITISHLTLTGPQLHGAIYGWGNSGLHLHDLRIEDFMYSGVRTYQTSDSKIERNTFVNTGQRWDSGKPGVKGGVTGGGIFAIWISDTEIAHNRFLDTKDEPNLHYYGIKGREGKRLKIHHNTIETNFSIEFPFDNDQDVEINHNILHGTVSIPKHGGGAVPESGRTFHIHHNYFVRSYAIEFPRNGVEIDHNFFDFGVEDDGGNLISGFGQAATEGPALFHNNLVSNPGRGVIWVNEPIANLTIRNNHIIARTTPTPREEGLFGFSEKSDFSTISITGNIIECEGTSRPLLRNDASSAATIRDNRLKGVTDTGRYENPMTGEPVGPLDPLRFACGVDGEMRIDGWKTSAASE